MAELVDGAKEDDILFFHCTCVNVPSFYAPSCGTIQSLRRLSSPNVRILALTFPGRLWPWNPSRRPKWRRRRRIRRRYTAKFNSWTREMVLISGLVLVPADYKRVGISWMMSVSFQGCLNSVLTDFRPQDLNEILVCFSIQASFYALTLVCKKVKNLPKGCHLTVRSLHSMC